MGEARNVVERFYQQFGAGDMTEAFACFDPECIALTPSGALNNEQHEAVARLLKHAIPDGHMELLRTIESDGEMYVTGRFKGTHRNDLATPLGTIVASDIRWTCSSPTTSGWRAARSSSVRPSGTGSASSPSSGRLSGPM
jgi:SnoaL-like domain